MEMQEVPQAGKFNSSNPETESSPSLYSSNQNNPDINLDFSLDGYDYNLPPELIAQNPLVPRDNSRLLVVDSLNTGIKIYIKIAFFEIYR